MIGQQPEWISTFCGHMMWCDPILYYVTKHIAEIGIEIESDELREEKLMVRCINENLLDMQMYMP